MLQALRPQWLFGGKPSRFQMLFGMDRRSLALYRILMGYTCFWDAWDRAVFVAEFYTDDGTMPRAAELAAAGSSLYLPSIHLVWGTWSFQATLMAIHLAVAFCMMVGYRTQLMTFLTWYFVNSVNERNQMVTHGGDCYLRNLLFFSFLLPLGDYCSVDAALRFARHDRPRGSDDLPDELTVEEETLEQIAISGNHYLTDWRTFGLGFQIFVLYVSSFYHKRPHAVWSEEGTALYWAMKMDFFRTSIGDLLFLMPLWLLKYMNFGVLYFEGYGPWLLVVPIWTPVFRTLGAFGIFCMHLGFFLCMRLDMFALVGMAGPFCFLPSQIWDRLLLPRLRTSARINARLYHTGGHFGRMAHIFAQFFLLPETKVGHVENAEVESRDVEAASVRKSAAVASSGGWVLIDAAGHTFSGWAAVRAAVSLSPLLWPLQYFLRFAWMERLWNTLPAASPDRTLPAAKPPVNPAVLRARREGFTGRLHWFWQRRKPILCTIVAWWSITLVYLVIRNDHQLPYAIPDSAYWYIHMTYLEQEWNMFSPPPHHHYQHYVRATLADDRVVELFRDEGMFKWEANEWNFNRVPLHEYWRNYKNHRWMKAWEAFNYANPHEVIRLAMGRFICRSWNTKYSGRDQLYTFDILATWDEQFIDGSRKEVDIENMWSHQCFEEHPKLNLEELMAPTAVHPKPCCGPNLDNPLSMKPTQTTTTTEAEGEAEQAVNNV